MAAMPQGPQGIGGLLDGQPSPEDLLAQIRDLLDQYLAAGPDTPVAAEAQNLAQAIDQTQGNSSAAPEGGGMPPEHLPDDHEGAAPVVPQENIMGGNQDPPPNPGAKTYKDANVSATERLKKRNKDQGR